MDGTIPTFDQPSPFALEVQADAAAMMLIEGYEVTDERLYFAHVGRLATEQALIRAGIVRRLETGELVPFRPESDD